MQVLGTRVEPGSASYQRNRTSFLREIEVLRGQLAELNRGGGEKYVARHRERGKLMARERIEQLYRFVAQLGKWSMLDVFVVAILIVLVKLGPLAKIQPQQGVYWFAAAILLSMITSMYIDSLARKSC